MTFTESDLGLTADQITEIKAGLTDTGADPPVDPIDRSIDEQTARIESRRGTVTITDDNYRRWLRSLVRFDLFTQLGTVSAATQREYDETMKELDALKSGAGGSGAWGSATRYQDS